MAPKSDFIQYGFAIALLVSASTGWTASNSPDSAEMTGSSAEIMDLGKEDLGALLEEGTEGEDAINRSPAIVGPAIVDELSTQPQEVSDQR